MKRGVPQGEKITTLRSSSEKGREVASVALAMKERS